MRVEEYKWSSIQVRRLWSYLARVGLARQAVRSVQLRHRKLKIARSLSRTTGWITCFYSWR